MLKALTLLEAYSDILEVSRQALELYPHNEEIANYKKGLEQYVAEVFEDSFGEPDPKEIADFLHAGRAVMVPYPWLPHEQRVRSNEVIADASKEMLDCSRQAFEVKKSLLGDNCLGVFAVKDISKDDVLLDSQGPIGVNCDQLSGNVCYNCYGKLGHNPAAFVCCPRLKFCGNKCRDIAEKFYHQAICGKHFAFVEAIKETHADFRDDDKHPFSTLAWLRMLAICVQDGRHPLDIPTFARLVPQHALPAPAPWDFDARVVQPNKVMQALGVDIFADQKYDAWVLENLWQVQYLPCKVEIAQDSNGRMIGAAKGTTVSIVALTIRFTRT